MAPMFPEQQPAPAGLADLLGGAQIPQDAPQDSGPSDPLDLLRNAIQSLQDYIDQEGDDINSEQASKVLAGLYRILSQEQKNSEQAMGLTPAHKAMRRSGGY